MAGHASSGAVPDVLLVLAAVLPWQLFASALSESSTSLIGNTSLISKVYFPRLIIPSRDGRRRRWWISSITLVLLAVVMAWYGCAPGWPAGALAAVHRCVTAALSLGLGLLLAALTVKYRDFRYVVPFIIQLGLFVSPVAFVIGAGARAVAAVYALNPLVGIIDGFRWSILAAPRSTRGRSPSRSSITLLSLWRSGVWYFRRTERGSPMRSDRHS